MSGYSAVSIDTRKQSNRFLFLFVFLFFLHNSLFVPEAKEEKLSKMIILINGSSKSGFGWLGWSGLMKSIYAGLLCSLYNPKNRSASGAYCCVVLSFYKNYLKTFI